MARYHAESGVGLSPVQAGQRWLERGPDVRCENWLSQFQMQELVEVASGIVIEGFSIGEAMLSI